MQDADFSDQFCKFLQSAIPAVDAAELLLALAAQPDTWWQPQDLVAGLRPGQATTEADAARHFDVFRARGLVETGPDHRIRFRPASEELAAHVRTLAQAYRERPATLIRVIYALRDARIQSFAEAFKLRRK
jgi:hypothetical protein